MDGSGAAEKKEEDPFPSHVIPHTRDIPSASSEKKNQGGGGRPGKSPNPWQFAMSSCQAFENVLLFSAAVGKQRPNWMSFAHKKLGDQSTIFSFFSLDFPHGSL